MMDMYICASELSSYYSALHKETSSIFLWCAFMYIRDIAD